MAEQLPKLYLQQHLYVMDCSPSTPLRINSSFFEAFLASKKIMTKRPTSPKQLYKNWCSY